MSAAYTSSIAEAIAPDLLQRFQRYVVIDTQSRRDQDRQPSTPGQLDLSRLLVAELAEAGLADARLDEHGYVYATLPANQEGAPAIGLIAHVDTSPDAPGAGVKPIVHRGYDGGVIELPRHGTRLDPAAMPELADKVGHDLVTASGDTLLGADDKAGVAAIMAAVTYLAAHPELPRCKLCVAFTPDEEIGKGAARFDVPRFGARFAYTVDGSELGELQDESFSALEAIIRIEGVEVHPGQAAGKLVSALRLAAQIVAELPSDRLTPDTAAERDGFIHPYELTGTASRAEIRVILRDFDEERLAEHRELLEQTARRVVGGDSRARLHIDVSRQYRNMRQFIEQAPELVEAAEEAMRAEGIEPVRRAIRGGTDGSLLSEMGLLTPNLFDGGHEYHSPREWASLQEMAASAATLVRLAGVWAARTPGDG
ncbi:MAG TPA: peptidase T [Solirubrobacteraceae bacterium]|nr:peptidase T [Solirubrobacteraceae bacterium]